MLSDYINKDAVAEMTFEEFEKIFSGNIEIARHKMTLEQAFKELGGKTAPKPKKSKKNEEGAE